MTPKHTALEGLVSLPDGVRLTQLSHGSGCGCKLSPSELEAVLSRVFPDGEDSPWPDLLVGNETRDDAAVLDIGGDELLLSTTDFFTPVVDDPYQYGRIAAANALSDVYAMGGRPVMALAVLGWPVESLDPALAAPIVQGGRDVCREAGIPLAGGHSIDAPEPFFGLAVSGLVERELLRTNAAAREGDVLFLTKPLGSGLLSTAEKYGSLRPQDAGVAAEIMGRLNTVGRVLARVPAVHAMTDVTGFGLLGHLVELCEAADLSAELDYRAVRQPTDLRRYVAAGALAKGLKNNWRSYGHQVSELFEPVRSILCDPQTGGGLLITVDPDGVGAVQDLLRAHGLEDHVEPIGRLVVATTPRVQVLGLDEVERLKVHFGPDAAARDATPDRTVAMPTVNAACTPPQPSASNPRETWRMMKSFFGDLWRHRARVKKHKTWIEKYAVKKGYRVNPRWMMNANLRLWLVEAEDTFGERICPCFEPTDDASANRAITCPCRYIDQDIAEKGTCHCTLFGAGDLPDEGFAEAEGRLMREYRVDLRDRGDMVDTSGIPTDPFRGLKVPDAYHLAKRAVMLRGLPVALYVERDFEAANITAWAEKKGFRTEVRPEGEGQRVDILLRQG